MKYRKKPVVVDAFRFGVDDAPKWFLEALASGCVTVIWASSGTTSEGLPLICYTKTAEGEMKAYQGDYIVRERKGELYPCRAEMFAQDYEPVDQS